MAGGRGGQSVRMAGVRGDECQCGRRASMRHCPKCGSSRLYAYAPRLGKTPDGKNDVIMGNNRCLSCGHQFPESEREFCDAPPFTAALAALKARRIYEAMHEGEQNKNEYLDPKVVAKAQELAGQVVTPTVEAFTEAKASETVATVIEGDIPQELADETVREFNKISPHTPDSAARRAFLNEWSSAKYAGRIVPKFEEFVERRMKGETVDVIVK